MPSLDTARADSPTIEQLRTASFLDVEKLTRIGDSLHESYQSAYPYPHVLLEDFLDKDTARCVAEEFPTPEDEVGWRQLNPQSAAGQHWQYNKLGLCSVNEMGAATRELIYELNSSSFIRFLERLTGVSIHYV